MIAFLEKLFNPKSNSTQIAKLMVDLLQVRITETTITKDIEEHPDYPSLLSISDVFNSYGIENVAINIMADKLPEVPFPFLTTMLHESGRLLVFTVVKDISDNTVTYYHPEKHSWQKVQASKFYEYYGGTVLLASPGDDAGEQDYDKVRIGEKTNWIYKQFITFSIPALIAITGLYMFISNGLQAMVPFLFSLTTMSGIAVCILLLWYEIDRYNPFLKKICTDGGQKMNCEAVLQSNASGIAGISWSIIGATYFIGMELMLLLTDITIPQTQFILSWINVLVLPYIIFSLYYQWRIAKQWCRLCLSVQAILFIQFSIAAFGGWHRQYNSSFFNSTTITGNIAAFTIPFIVLWLLMPALKSTKENKTNHNKLQRLKHNPQIFEALLAEQPRITAPTDDLGIILGNPDARFKLVKVCNPYCGYCATVHTPMENLLAANKDLQIQIIFTTPDNKNDTGSWTTKHLLAIYEKGEESLTKYALDAWYNSSEKNYSSFANQFPIEQDMNEPSEMMFRMYNWCEEMKISGTPAFFLNGHKLPDIYTVQDLKYFLSV